MPLSQALEKTFYLGLVDQRTFLSTIRGELRRPVFGQSTSILSRGIVPFSTKFLDGQPKAAKQIRKRTTRTEI